jgi:hypothetical protein
VSASKFLGESGLLARAAESRADVVGDLGESGAAQAVLDQDGGGGPDRCGEDGDSVASPWSVRCALIRPAGLGATGRRQLSARAVLAQFGGEDGDVAQLQDQEGGQVGGLDDAFGLEG